MVSVLVVSHSQQLAQAMVELIKEMKSEPFQFDYLGGIENGQAFGSNPLEIKSKIEALDEGDGVLVIADMGSSIMNSQMAISMLAEAPAQKVKLVNAPFFESTLAAVVANAPGMGVDQLLAVAEDTMNHPKF